MNINAARKYDMSRTIYAEKSTIRTTDAANLNEAKFMKFANKTGRTLFL